jgi:branched-chain amino acid transport system permease protein
VGALLGALLVPVGFEEVTRLLVRLNVGPPNLIPALEWVAIGLLIIGFLWFRPEGVRPETRHVFEGAPLMDES